MVGARPCPYNCQHIIFGIIDLIVKNYDAGDGIVSSISFNVFDVGNGFGGILYKEIGNGFLSRSGGESPSTYYFG